MRGLWRAQTYLRGSVSFVTKSPTKAVRGRGALRYRRQSRPSLAIDEVMIRAELTAKPQLRESSLRPRTCCPSETWQAVCKCKAAHRAGLDNLAAVEPSAARGAEPKAAEKAQPASEQVLAN